MMNQLEIYNTALTKLGAPLASSINDTSKEVITLNAIYTNALHDLLSEFPYHFSRTTTHIYQHPEKNIESVSINSTTITIQITNHGYVNNNTVSVINLKPDDYNGKYSIANVNNNTFTYTVQKNVGNPINSNSRVRLSHPEFEYAYTLPTDMLFPIRLMGASYPYTVDNNFLYTNVEDKIFLEYIQKNPSIPLYNIKFDWLLASRLAAESCITITGDRRFAEILTIKYYNELREAKLNDAYFGFEQKQYNSRDKTSDYSWVIR